MSFLNELKRRNVLRVGAAYIVGSWLLIQVAETIFPLFGFGDTPARLVVIILAIGFIPSLIVAWVFEITPEGLKRDADVDLGKSIAPATGKKLDRIILLVLVVALAFFAFDRFVLVPVRMAEIVEETTEQARSDALVESYGEKSIAVLPFVNMSDDASNEYFSDGISEELLNLLAQTPELRVISRSSAFAFKGEKIDIPDVARKLNVAHVLEGSVRKAGSRVRITAQLVDARSDTHLWSDTFDRDLDDIFKVQDEIAREIGEALKVELALTETGALPSVSQAVSVDAYDVYLKGRKAVNQRDPDSLADAIRHFERALRLDANFAPAHAQLAIATILQVQVGASTLEDARFDAAPHIKRAMELDPDLAEVYAARALLASIELDPEAMIENARRVLALNPSYSDAHTIMANALDMLGRYQEAEEAFRKVLVVDPLNIMGLRNYVGRLNRLDRSDEAHEVADRLVELNPAWGYDAHAYTSGLFEGKIAEGLEWALRKVRATGRVSGFASFSFMWIGEYEESRRLGAATVWVDVAEGRMDEAIEKTQRALKKDPDNTGKIAMAANVLYQAGHVGEALPLLERALDLGPDGRPIVAHLDQFMTMILADARRQSGDEQGAEAVASMVREDHAARVAAGRQHVNLDIWGALVAAFDGDYDAAIAYMRSAVNRGLRDDIFGLSMFNPFNDDPRFIAIQEDLDRILAQEHEKVLQLICFNNPVPDDWRPLPETCEGVVEQSTL